MSPPMKRRNYALFGSSPDSDDEDRSPTRRNLGNISPANLMFDWDDEDDADVASISSSIEDDLYSNLNPQFNPSFEELYSDLLSHIHNPNYDGVGENNVNGE